MTWILDLIYLLVLVLSLPWQLYRAAFQGKSRRGWVQKILGAVPPRDGKTIWIHAVSVGEVILMHGFLEQLRDRYPDHHFVCSTSTETGYDLACQKFGQDNVFFFPWDFSWAVAKTVRRIQPEFLILAELEVWPNLLALMNKKRIPVIVVNGRLSENSFRGYRKFQWFWRPVFSKLDLVACQDDVYAQRFQSLGATNVCVTGNLKFDGTITDRDHASVNELQGVLPWDEKSFVWVAGSTQPEEDEMIVRLFCELVAEHPELKLIIAPRHLQNVGPLTTRLEGQGIAYRLRSTTGQQGFEERWNE